MLKKEDINIYKLPRTIYNSSLRAVSMLPSDPQGLLDAYIFLEGFF